VLTSGLCGDERRLLVMVLEAGRGGHQEYLRHPADVGLELTTQLFQRTVAGARVRFSHQAERNDTLVKFNLDGLRCRAHCCLLKGRTE
jgi:hypothetical protein